MSWLEEIEIEKSRALRSENPGKIRVAARRMVLQGVIELQQQNPANQKITDAISALNIIAEHPESKTIVCDAANRLLKRLDKNFNSPSVEPIKDAEIIISFISSLLHNRKQL